MSPKYYSAERVQDLRELVVRGARRYGDRIAFKDLDGAGNVHQHSFRQLQADVAALGTALLDRGFAGKHVALVGESSYSYVLCYLAVVNIGAVVVPIDKELTKDELIQLMRRSDVEALLHTDTLSELDDLLKQCPRISIAANMGMYARDDEGPGINALLELGRTLVGRGDRRYEDLVADPEALCAILFTSGTTGANKGVMLCQRNLTTVIHGAFSLFRFQEVSMSVLPIHHSYEFNLHVLGSIYGGITLCFNDSLMHVAKNLLLYQPQMSLMVPMIVDALHKNIWREATKHNLARHLRYGIWYSNLLRRIGIDQSRFFFKPILTNLGGQLQMIVCGAAPLNPALAKGMTSLGIEVYNGYGITECAPLIASNCPLLSVNGSVGRTIPGLELRIDSPDADGSGEIQVRGDNVMLGYYNDPDATARSFTADGWFKTGDLGRIGRRGALFITGRQKNLIVLPNGKNVQPEELEELLYVHIDYLKEVVVHQGLNTAGGEIIVASGYLQPEYVQTVGLEAAQDQFRADVARINRRVAGYKNIHQVHIREAEFEKTSTRKIKRHISSGAQQ